MAIRKLEELLIERQRAERALQEAEADAAAASKKIKERLLAGDLVEQGRFTAEVELLPGRDPASKNPDDYKLVMHVVQ